MSGRTFFLSWGMLLLGVLMNVFGIYVVKIKINELGQVQFSSLGAVVRYFLALASSPLAVVGAFAILAAPFPYAIALSRMDLSTAYPVSVALSCLIVIPPTVMFLGESMTTGKLLGILLMVASIFLLYRQ